MQDEFSYLLQSRIFATGHWTAASPPVPDFFQQPHVLTVPAVASKFFPGHALLMTIGALVGAPALVPLLLTGIAGALLFALARRIANEWVALLAWIVWIGDPINVRFRAGYLSEVTSGALWLAAWWALLEWRETRERRWLLAVAAAVGWGAITRPLTMLAFALPVGVIVVRDVVRLRLWRDFACAAALGTLVLGVIPLWSARTTGDWRLTPQTLYTRDYLPFDKPGFGADRTPPTQPLSAPNRYVYNAFYSEHAEHTLAHLPRIALDRLAVIAHDEWSGARVVLIPFVLVGLFSMTGELLFALICGAALFVAYLSYGHWVHWTLYYFEGLPVLSVIAALGFTRTLMKVGAIPFARLAAATAGLLFLVSAYELRSERAYHAAASAWDRAFQELIVKLPVSAAVIFVRYDLGAASLPSIVANSPHLDNDAVWVVNDLGARDNELMNYAGQRIPFDFYVATGKLEIDRALLRPFTGK